jgi:hypothetical protein
MGSHYLTGCVRLREIARRLATAKLTVNATGMSWAIRRLTG